MKKLLTSSMIFLAMLASFVFVANTFATDLGSYSADVTVGEVDKIGTEEDKDVDVPQTGVFGLGFENELVTTSVVLVVPITIFLALLLRYYYMERNKFIKQVEKH